jgi:hypothetical protein
MYADALPVLRGKSAQREIVQMDETIEKLARGIEFHCKAPFRKIDLDLVHSFLQGRCFRSS